MEIEVITTKKKLSKAVVKQLEVASVHDMHHCFNVIKRAFFVRGLGSKYTDNTDLFEGINGWKVMPLLDWKELSESMLTASARPYRRRGCMTKRFETAESRDKWIKDYNNLKSLALKNHLIL